MKGISIFLILLFSCPIGDLFAIDQTKIDSLKSVLSTTKTDTVKVNVLNQLFWEYVNTDKKQKTLISFPKDARKKALSFSLQALKLAEEIPYPKGIAASLFNRGIYHSYNDEYEPAIQYFEQSLEIAESIDYKKGVTNALVLLGNVAKSQGDYPNAIAFYNRVSKVYYEMKNMLGVIGCKNNIASIYSGICQYDKAIAYYLECLDWYQKENDGFGMTLVFINLGGCFIDLNEIEKGLNYYEQAVDICKKQNNEHWMISILLKISKAYIHCKRNYQKARELLDEVLSYREQGGEKIELIKALNLSSTWHFHRKAYDDGLLESQRALALAEEINYKIGTSNSLSNIGNIYAKKGFSQLAIHNYQKALDLYRELGNTRSEMLHYKSLAQAHKSLGQYEKALTYHSQYASLKDSVFNQEKSKQISELEIKHEIQKKEKTIALQEAKLNEANWEIVSKTHQRNIVLLSLVLILIFTYSGFIYYRQRKEIEEQKLNSKIKSQLHQINMLQAKIERQFDGKIARLKINIQKEDINAVLVEPLTDREWEVLECLSLGLTNKEIATKLFVSPGTVKTHTLKIYSKLEVRNRTEAVRKISLIQ